MRVHKPIIWAIGVVLFLVIGVLLVPAPYLKDLIQPPVRAPEKTFKLGRRLLVVAPHPDDETLGGAGLILKALAAGAKVKVVIMTSGDGYREAVRKNFNVAVPGPADFRRLGVMRHEESVRAMKRLGLRESDLIFLAYPDGGTNGMWEFNWDYSNLHRGLNGAVRAPYPFAAEKQAPYCGANVVKSLTAVLRNFQPTDVLYPDANDQHHDHWATNAFVKYVLTLEKMRVSEWTYLVHRGDFPWPWEYNTKLALTPPAALRPLDTHWLYPPLSPREQNLKLAAVKEYKSQTHVINPFLEAFVRKNELVGTYSELVLPQAALGSPDFDNPHKFPYQLFPDAAADDILTELEPQGDIIALGGVLSGRRLSIGLETKVNAAKPIQYNLHLRLFRPEGVKRVDLSVAGFQVTQQKWAENSIIVEPKPLLHIWRNRLWLTLPPGLMDNTSAFMISADTLKGRRRIDKAAWRLVELSGT